MKAQQVVHTVVEVDGILIGFRFPAATTSVNVPGWHFHFLSADRSRGGHVLGLTTGAGLALLEECSELRISLPARALQRAPAPMQSRRWNARSEFPWPGAPPRAAQTERAAPPSAARECRPMPVFCAAPKKGVGRNSVIVRRRAARYKLAPRAGASLRARGCNVFAEEWRRYTGQDQGLPTFRQRALHE